jgi:glycosyltransferase involved in cell wall biosynthesis
MCPVFRRLACQRLRIAVVSTPFLSVPPPDYGGTELVVAELVDGLIERGAEVTVFATGDSRGGFRHACEVRAAFARAAWPPDPFVELEHCAYAVREILADDNSFDVVHAHTPSFVPLAGRLTPQTPLVLTLHHPFDPALTELYQRHAGVSFAAISARQLELMGPFERSAVIHHGLSPERYRLAPPRPDAVAFLGRLARVKGPHLAIDVAARAGLNLRIGGRPHGEDREYYRDEVAPRLEEPHVEYLGAVNHVRKLELLSTARALLFPIDWEEPFGLVALEAMLCGCPVVAFRRGAVPELVEEGVTGFIARDPEHMAELLRGPAHPERFDRAGCRARAAARFCARRMVDDYLELFERARAGDLGANLAAGEPDAAG